MPAAPSNGALTGTAAHVVFRNAARALQAACWQARRRPPVLALGIVLGLSALLASAPAAAQWKWRDRNGQMVISDVPPPAGTPDRDILQRPPSARPANPSPLALPAPASAAASAAAPASPASAARAEPELDARKAKAEAEDKQKQKAQEEAEAARRAENCSRARRQVTALESGQRMSRLNDKGEREVLDDKGRADELDRARSIVGSDCK